MTSADLAAWQARLGLSQVEAAQRLNMPAQTYRNLLKGRRHAESLPGAIALLCQYIEEASKGTGSVVTPQGTGSVVTPHGVLSVTADEIRILDQTLLVELLRQLLHVEAESAGLSRSGIHVPAQIHVADGGEDGRIEWSGGPDQTRFLPGRLVQFQVKATDMPPAKCCAEIRDKDGSIKERIRATLEAGGSYVIFCNRPCTKVMIDERIERMRQLLGIAGLAVASTAKLDFLDANRISDWANSHYPVALWVIERVRHGGILPFLSLERWGNEKRVAEFEFVADPRAKKYPVRSSKRCQDPGECCVLRVCPGSARRVWRLRHCEERRSDLAPGFSIRTAVLEPNAFWGSCSPFESTASQRSSSWMIAPWICIKRSQQPPST